jgi:hypothetical protein
MSKKALTGIIIFLLGLVLALALNPSGERHRQAIRDAEADRSPIAGALGLGALKSLVVEYHSLGIASYTSMDDRVISVGAMGLVHVTRSPPPKE